MGTENKPRMEHGLNTDEGWGILLRKPRRLANELKRLKVAWSNGRYSFKIQRSRSSKFGEFRGRGRSSDFMKSFLSIARRLLTTNYAFEERHLAVRILGVFTVRIPYTEILLCSPRISKNNATFYSKPEAWKECYVILPRLKKLTVVLKVADIESFTNELRKRSPHTKILEPKVAERNISIG